MAWYEDSFGDDYKVVYRHRNWQQAAHEVSTMAAWLQLPPGAALLDVGCGMGRHALALQELGYNVTGMDLSKALLREAQARDGESRVSWKHGDMRNMPFPAASFDATVNLFTSFGYFESEADNETVLRELRRVLKAGGKFLIDYLNPVQVRRTLVPHSVRLDEPTGWTITEERRADQQWVRKQIVIELTDGQQRRYEEQVRLYGLDWFASRLEAADLRLMQVYGGYDGSVYDVEQSKRLIMVGEAGR
ncbi:class I SAM-dependent methyltransferase [Paenibacillus sp. 1P07SE]|uniref:class I SAM-dependent methyltransferase n=1 Tax=Paenibacillus sp. 1P07SE TaxID=3132209 RepID=UPI0039A598EA